MKFSERKKNPEMFPLKSLTQQRRKKRIPQEIKRQTRMTPLQKLKKRKIVYVMQNIYNNISITEILQQQTPTRFLGRFFELC